MFPFGRSYRLPDFFFFPLSTPYFSRKTSRGILVPVISLGPSLLNGWTSTYVSPCLPVRISFFLPLRVLRWKWVALLESCLITPNCERLLFPIPLFPCLSFTPGFSWLIKVSSHRSRFGPVPRKDSHRPIQPRVLFRSFFWSALPISPRPAPFSLTKLKVTSAMRVVKEEGFSVTR